MVYSTVNKKDEAITVNSQNLPKFERKGFTVIEWGGSEITLNQSTL